MSNSIINLNWSDGVLVICWQMAESIVHGVDNQICSLPYALCFLMRHPLRYALCPWPDCVAMHAHPE
jgi:hypothetical protein